MMPLSESERKYLADIRRSQQPVVALETTKEQGVALATDEMRGYPDNSATGIHLAKPRCSFSDMCRQQCEEKDDFVESVTILPLYYYIFFFLFYDHIHC